MVWNSFIFTPIWGRFSNLTNIFQVGWSHHQKRSRHVFFSGVLTAAHWGSDRQSSGEVVEACSIVTSKWSRGYPPKKNDMTSWKIHHDPPWRCISYWKWWFSNVMLFFRGVRDFRSSQEKTGNHHWIYFHKPSWHVDIPKSNLSTLYFVSDIYIYIIYVLSANRRKKQPCFLEWFHVFEFGFLCGWESGIFQDFTSGPSKLISGKHIHQGMGRDVPRSQRGLPMGNP